MKRIFLVLLALVFFVALASAIPPVANFTANPWIGAAPLGVNFTDTSTGSPTSYAWWYGDEQYDYAWINVTDPSVWTPRSEQSAAVVSPYGDIIMVGGHDAGGPLNDTWISTNDGNTWSEQNASSGWTVRSQPSLVGMPDGTLVLMAGYKGSSDYNDTWASTNEGATWIKKNASSGWTGRQGQSVVSTSDNKLVLTGGIDAGYTYYNDTWMSSDHGATWTKQNSSSGWKVRAGHRMVITPDNTIILMGGGDAFTDYNDTWTSSNLGVSWTKVNASSGWISRISFGAVAVPNGDIMLMGGEDFSMNIYSDVWVSQNKGISWTQVTSASWAPRVSLSATSTPDGLIEVMGGSDVGGYTNDVWNNQVAGDVTPTPYHLFTSVGIYPVLLEVHNLDGTSSIRHNVTASYYSGPHANFNWTQPTVFNPLSVSFNDLSTNNATGWGWFFGDEPYNQSWNFQNTSHGEWDSIGAEGTVLPNGHIIMTGGTTPGSNPGSSKNSSVSIDGGKTWTLKVSPGGEWDERWQHNVVALPSGNAVLLNGRHQFAGADRNDVWSTSNEGGSWVETNASPGWEARSGSSSVTMQTGDIVMMGGYSWNSATHHNDVWLSPDSGTTWYEQTAGAGWAGRRFASAVVTSDNRIILMGGTNNLTGATSFNDVWESDNEGVTWTETNPSASWTPRSCAEAVYQPDGSIVLIGGWNSSGYISETWRSQNNGLTWTQLTNTNLNATTLGTAVPMPNGSIVEIGGGVYGGPALPVTYGVNAFSPQGSNSQNPSHNYAAGGFYTVSLQSFNQNGTSVIQKLLSLTNAYWLNLTFVDASSNATINVVSVNDSMGNSYTTSGGTNSTKYFAGPVTIYATSIGYYQKVASFNLNNDTSSVVALTKVVANNQNTWWTPHTVQITIMDNYGQRLVGVNINASYNQSAMPISWIQQLYGIQAGPSADMVNSALVLGGTTGSDGTLTTTMLGSLKYDIYLTSATYGLNNYYVAAYPSDPMLNIYVATAASALITNASNSLYTALNGTKVYFTEPDINNVSMCINYVDNNGLTTSVNETWEFSNNNSVFFNQVLPNPGTTPNLTCITRPNIRGTQVWWGYNASRSV